MRFSILEILKENFKKYRAETAFYISNKTFSYGDLERKIVGIQKLLIEEVSKKEKIIGIVTANDLETYASIFACWFSGRAFVPLNPLNPQRRNEIIIENTGLQSIMHSGVNKLTFRNSGSLHFINTREANFSDARILNISTEDPESLKYILYTSGSTGNPKGVPITRGNLYSFFSEFGKFYPDVNSKDRFLQIYDLSFDGSLPAYIFPLLKGASVYTVSQDKIKYLSAYQLIKEHRLTFIKMAPSTLVYLRPYFDTIHLPEIKYCLFGGEALPADLVREWQKCVPGSKIHNVYGPTESTVISTLYDWTDGFSGGKESGGIVSIGKPLGKNKVRICDQDMNPVMQGKKGELCISGPQVMEGYWKDDEKSREAFLQIGEYDESETYYRTGDIVFEDDEGFLMFSGRVDSQVQIQGHRVELGEIDRFAREYYKDKNVCTTCRKGGSGPDEIVLFVEAGSSETGDIENFLRNRLPGYMLPGKIVSIPEFPRTPGGKTDRKMLMKLL